MKQNRSFSQAKWNNRTKWAIFVFCLVQQMNYLEQFQENTKIDRYFKYQIYNKQFFFWVEMRSNEIIGLIAKHFVSYILNPLLIRHGEIEMKF